MVIERDVEVEKKLGDFQARSWQRVRVDAFEGMRSIKEDVGSVGKMKRRRTSRTNGGGAAHP